MNSASLPMLWATCVERLKDRINNRSVWEALEHTRPIVVEDNALIIGMDAEDFQYATYLQQTSTLHTVHKTVEEVFNSPYQVRLIEGTLVADWEIEKKNAARVAAMKEQMSAAASAPPAPVERGINADSWDAVNEQLHEMYLQTPLRFLPQVRARYLNEALYILAEAMATLYPAVPDEGTERHLARIIERVAESIEMPASSVAFELERLVAWNRESTEDTTPE